MPDSKHSLPLAKGFLPQKAFYDRTGSEYSLLPLRFMRLDSHRYVATNFSGEHLVLDEQDLLAFVQHKLIAHTPTYNRLKSKHFLLDGDSTVALDLLACKYRTKQRLLAELTSLFMFVVTLRCEHSCPYCQVSRQSRDRDAFDMSLEHAAKAVEFVFASPARQLKIEFQGGEPLLNFEVVRWVVEAIESKNRTEQRSISFVIATNLALVTKEVLEYCREHGILISTSLDGPSDLHNANRPRPGNNSHELAVQGINLAREYLGVEQVAAVMTTTRGSLTRAREIIDEYVRQGFDSIFLRPLSPFGFAVKTGLINQYTTAEWLSFYRESLLYILQLNRDGVRFKEEYTSLILRRILSPFPTGYVDLQSPAGAGIGCMAFNYNGDIYASDESRMLAEMGDHTFRIGHLSSDSFESVVTSDLLVEMLSNTLTESMPMCSDCGIQPYCGSDPLYHYATQGDMVGRKPLSGFCHKNMDMTTFLIGLLEDDEWASSLLKSWL